MEKNKYFCSKVFYCEYMEESLIKDVLSFLSEEHQVQEEELFVQRKTFPSPLGYKGNEEIYVVVLSSDQEKLVCSWSEVVKKNGKIVWLVYGIKNTRTNVLDFLKKQITCSEFLLEMYRKRSKEVETLRKENSRLVLENERLTIENLELSFAPGGKGALEAQEHFERLVKQ
ncbi:HTH-containing DNA-binding protein [Tokyovirus A1]|uniref:HTH-containing DNA-binding protein n=1 Tax=Tokyovirus A1 TaxID=1826170 RepID=UPI0007A97FDD|nr:HTH-containing DNA-binding protein [Tokyovirus A1]BAU79906.1 HTH-containing DNA-binding protein [Tokyovirus A1]